MEAAAVPLRRRASVSVWSAGEWTRVIAGRRGYLRLSTRFAPERILEHGRRCDSG
jgi:hypothetical protein